MENKSNIDLLTAIKKLVAENKSQEERLEYYAKTIESRDKEIEMLQSMLTDANEYRSGLDNQVMELKDLQYFLTDLQQQVAGTSFNTNDGQQKVSGAVSMEEQHESLKQEYAFLQSQVKDLQQQLQEMNSRNLQLHQQTSRIAELESLLANADDEIGRVKRNENSST